MSAQRKFGEIFGQVIPLLEQVMLPALFPVCDDVRDRSSRQFLVLGIPLCASRRACGAMCVGAEVQVERTVGEFVG